MKKYRGISVLLGAVLTLSFLFGGCRTSGQTGQTQGTPAAEGGQTKQAEIPEEDLIEITEIVWDRGTIPADQGTLEDNWWVDYVNEQMRPLGIKVNYVIVPKQQNTELLSTMLAANNAPDLVKTSDIALLKSYISKGGVADMGPYLKEFGQNILNFYSDEELKDGQSEGRQYMLYHKQNDFMRTTFVRKDWLDQLNIPLPSNPQEFRDMLAAIKENDPGNVGDPLITLGMIGQVFSAWDMVMLPAFVNEEPTVEKLLTPRIMWPEAKECLRYLNGLYNDGLLGEFVLDKDESLFRQKIARGEMAAFIASGQYPYHSAYGNLYDTLRGNQPEAKLTAIWPWQNESGQNYYQIYDSAPMYKYMWFIPSSCKNVEAVVKYLNWMSSEEGYMVGCLGVEGEDYVMEDGVPKPLVDTENSRVTWIEPQYGTIGKPFNGAEDKDYFIKNYIKDFNSDYHEEILATAKCLSEVKYYRPTLSVPTPVTDEVSATLAQMQTDNIAKIICAAPGEFDRIYDQFLEDYKNAGGQESAEEQIAAYKQMGN